MDPDMPPLVYPRGYSNNYNNPHDDDSSSDDDDDSDYDEDDDDDSTDDSMPELLVRHGYDPSRYRGVMHEDAAPAAPVSSSAAAWPTSRSSNDPIIVAIAILYRDSVSMMMQALAGTWPLLPFAGGGGDDICQRSRGIAMTAPRETVSASSEAAATAATLGHLVSEFTVRGDTGNNQNIADTATTTTATVAAATTCTVAVEENATANGATSSSF
jgi:hypothetical protein